MVNSYYQKLEKYSNKKSKWDYGNFKTGLKGKTSFEIDIVIFPKARNWEELELPTLDMVKNMKYGRKKPCK